MHHPVIQQITKEISKFSDVEEVILFGSRATGQHHPYSDIDIAVSGNLDGETWQQINKLADVEDDTIPTLLKIDLVQLEKAGDTLRHSIIREGQILYEHKSSTGI